ncbi:MAG: hypothetical protein K1X57_09025 [Gemmataceae bacterium]|nr:hypothetical protein [Gemmataceae bacterium]
MVRVLTTIWFTFISLLGPGVCCCTLRAAGPSPDENDPPAQRSCCCEIPVEDDKPASPAPTHDCPCKRTREVAQASVATNLAVSPIAGYVVAPWPGDPVTTAIIANFRHLAGSRPPSHFTINILYACHILRC